MDKLNLVPAIKAIEQQICEIASEYNKLIEKYKTSLSYLRELNDYCEKCCGEGKILRSRCCAEDDRPDPNDPRDYITCDNCGGTGIVTREKCKPIRIKREEIE